MKTTTAQRTWRFGWILALVCLAAPIAGAGTMPAKRTHPTVTMRHATAAPVDGSGIGDGDTVRRTAMLDGASGYAMDRMLFVPDEGRRDRSNAQARAVDEQSGEEMGLGLPEPGPLSAIVATVMLAAFILIRRAF